jgi:hypothetical protein
VGAQGSDFTLDGSSHNAFHGCVLSDAPSETTQFGAANREE